MGYSIMVKIENESLYKKMYGFMKDKFKAWSWISGEEENYCSSEIDNDPIYSPEYKLSYILGFDYNSSAGLCREYVFMICYWMAIKCNNELKDSTIVLYDGVEVIEFDDVIRENNGFTPLPGHLFGKLSEYRLDEKTIIESKIKDELNRLSIEWEKL